MPRMNGKKTTIEKEMRDLVDGFVRGDTLTGKMKEAVVANMIRQKELIDELVDKNVELKNEMYFLKQNNLKLNRTLLLGDHFTLLAKERDLGDR